MVEPRVSPVPPPLGRRQLLTLSGLALGAGIWQVCRPARSRAATGLAAPPRGGTRLVLINDLNGSYGSTTYIAEVHRGVALIPPLRPDLVICAGDMVAGQKAGLGRQRLAAMWAGFDRSVLGPLRNAGLPFAPPQIAGWHRVPTPFMLEWTPRVTGADHHIQLRYADDQGHIVDMVYALYSAQGPGKKASGYGEGALPLGTPWQWQGPGAPAYVARSERLLANGRVARLAQTTWRTGDTTTGSAVALRLANLADRLMLRRRPTMMMILSVEEPASVAAGAQGDPAAQTLAQFRRAMGPLGTVMDQIAQGV